MTPLSKDGSKQFAVLPYEDFRAVQERLADADDLLEPCKARPAGPGNSNHQYHGFHVLLHST